MVVQAISPLLRSDFAQSTAGQRRTATSRTVSSSSDGSAVPPIEQSAAETATALGKVAHMHPHTTIEPTGRRRAMLARLWSVIPGDAYPPETPASVAPATPQTKER
jgi:hypothetical protein